MTLAYEHLVPFGLTILSLDDIRRFLGWDLEGAHTAMKDVEDAQRLYTLTCRGLSREAIAQLVARAKG